MAEFKPRWMTSEIVEVSPHSATDSTDSFPSPAQTVSAVSDHSHPDQEFFPLQSALHVTLTAVEAEAVGLDTTLRWMHVDQRPVAATIPPSDWNGTVPDNCGVPRICATLGPCEIFVTHGSCWAAMQATGTSCPTVTPEHDKRTAPVAIAAIQPRKSL